MAIFNSKQTNRQVFAIQAPWNNYDKIKGMNLKKGEWAVGTVEDYLLIEGNENDDYDRRLSDADFRAMYDLAGFHLTGESMGSLCAMDSFFINGIYAQYEDFGSKYDHDSYNAPDYGCGDMRFDPEPSTPQVLAKYGISEEEYDIVCEFLREKLDFGRCGWCV